MAPEMSQRLIREKVAATPMTGWGGAVANRHIRFVFSNEPVERLAGLGDRVKRALARDPPRGQSRFLTVRVLGDVTGERVHALCPLIRTPGPFARR
jgi:hypothetical protein